MNTEKLRKSAYLTVTAIGICAAAYLFLRYLFIYLCPFLLGFAIAAAANRPAGFLSGKTKVPKGVYHVAFAILFSFGVMAGLGFLVYRGAADGVGFLTSLSENGSLGAFIGRISTGISSVFADVNLGAEVEASFAETGRNLLSKTASALASFLAAAVRAVPKILLFSFITGISAVYFAIDGKKIGNLLRSLLPEKLSSRLCSVKDGVFGAMFQYLRVYCLLGAMTFALMTVGFALLQIEYALLLSLVVALLDALPVIGVGTVLLPWAAVELAMGNPRLAVGLLILWGVNEILRQIIEPRLIGRSLGIHPLLSLFLLYIGYALFGILGLFLLPVLAATAWATLKMKKGAPAVGVQTK
ncbi:MAG: AI-2E family transporter [Clostridia bacterium]|nr:AI-2E family transporter [Clostridia bacterium]